MMELAQYLLDIILDLRSYVVQSVQHRPLQHEKKALRSGLSGQLLHGTASDCRHGLASAGMHGEAA